jgi:hypothetical protein
VSAPLFPTPWMYGRRRLTRVELAVYAVVVGTLIVVFSRYMLDYMEMAEKTAMETTVSNVTTAINLRYAALIMAGGRVDAAKWMTGNPFELAHAFPPSYRGDLVGPAAGGIDRPAWFFDSVHRELVYFPRLDRYLRSAAKGEVRFRLEPHSSGFGFVLAPTPTYEWSLAGGADAAAILARSAINSQSGFRNYCTPLFS